MADYRICPACRGGHHGEHVGSWHLNVGMGWAYLCNCTGECHPALQEPLPPVNIRTRLDAIEAQLMRGAGWHQHVDTEERITRLEANLLPINVAPAVPAVCGARLRVRNAFGSSCVLPSGGHVWHRSDKGTEWTNG